MVYGRTKLHVQDRLSNNWDQEGRVEDTEDTKDDGEGKLDEVGCN